MFTVNTKIYASQCDPAAHLSLLSAMNLVQDNASGYLADLGYTQTSMKKEYNCVWMYTKTKTIFLSTVDWNEELVIESFISARSAMRLTVDVIFKSRTGEKKLYSRVEMCIFDLSEKKPRLLDDILPDNLPIAETEITEPMAKLRFENGEKISEITVPSTSIDFCHHTNNVEYLRFILDTYSVERILSTPVKGLDVTYLMQTREGEKLEIYKNEEGNFDLFTICSSSAPVLKCRIEF